MRIIFADTSYWFALLVRADPWHEIAVLLSLELSDSHIITTEMVLTELLNGVSRLGEYHRNLATDEVIRLRANSNVEVIAQSEDQFHNAFDYYRSRSDQRWGLTDCASFIVMQERGITHALTADRDFAQAGFTILMQ